MEELKAKKHMLSLQIKVNLIQRLRNPATKSSGIKTIKTYHLI